MRPLPRAAAWALALVAGLAQATSIAAPWNGQPQWWLQLLSLALLAGLVQRESRPGRAALTGWLFALAWLTGTFWWLFVSMHVYGGLPSVMAGAAVLSLAGLLGLYYALACGVAAWAARADSRWGALVFAACWLGAELMRVSWFTGFPWGAGGYAHVDGPLAALAPWVGVHGIGFVAAAVAFEVAAMARPGAPQASRRRLAGFGLLAIVAVSNLIGTDAPAPAAAKPLSVALLQGNIAQDQKFEVATGVPVALGWYRDALAGVSESLAVTPETALPLLPHQLPPGYLGGLGRRDGAAPQALLVGMPLGSFTAGYTNSVVGLVAGSQSYRYDKHHLVPFGEFIPPMFRWFTRMMDIPLGDFGRGAVAQDSFEWRGERLAPNICYEDLFGEELGARFVDAARAPTVFVNMSNIGWFGDTLAIDQHLQISRMRALEFARPMLRATNTGATAIIDAQGRVTHLLPRLTRGVLHGEVVGGRRLTPYAWWVARLGLWPLWGLALLLPAAAGWARRRPSA